MIQTSEQIDQVAKAMAAARSVMGVVPERGTMQGHGNYRYARIEDYLGTIEAPLAAQGLVVIASVPAVESLPERIIRSAQSNGTVKESTWYAARVHLDMRIVHTASGQWIEVSAWADFQSDDEKAVSKATTAARKNALACLFNLVTGDERSGSQQHAQAGKSAPQGKVLDGPDPNIARLMDLMKRKHGSEMSKVIREGLNRVGERTGKKYGGPKDLPASELAAWVKELEAEEATA